MKSKFSLKNVNLQSLSKQPSIHTFSYVFPSSHHASSGFGKLKKNNTIIKADKRITFRKGSTAPRHNPKWHFRSDAKSMSVTKKGTVSEQSKARKKPESDFLSRIRATSGYAKPHVKSRFSGNRQTASGSFSGGTKVIKRGFFTVKTPSSEADVKVGSMNIDLDKLTFKLDPFDTVVREFRDEFASSGPVRDLQKVRLKPIVHNVMQVVRADQHMSAWTDTERICINTELAYCGKNLDELIPPDIFPLDTTYREIPALLEQAAREKDSELLLRCAANVRQRCYHGIADLPLCSLDSKAQTQYREVLDFYNRARASNSQILKLTYVNVVKDEVLPRLWDDVSYFQAISMLLSYVHLEADTLDVRLPFSPHTFSIIDPKYRTKLKNTKELALTDWVLQTGGENAGVKIKLWLGLDEVGKSTDTVIVDCMGTNSMGPSRDQIYAKKGVVTGALADKDPKGIAYSAYQKLNPVIEQMMRKYASSDTLIINTGHSLGASVAAHSYMSLLQNGYDNCYLYGYNGAAISNEVSLDIQKHALDHVLLVHNKRDVVQYGSTQLLPGVHREYPFLHAGTIGPWNPLYGSRNDPIFHGDMQHLAAVMFGVPPTYTSFTTDTVRRGFLRRVTGLLANYHPGLLAKLVTTVLKPDPSEYEKIALSYIRRSDAPSSSPFQKDTVTTVASEVDNSEDTSTLEDSKKKTDKI